MWNEWKRTIHAERLPALYRERPHTKRCKPRPVPSQRDLEVHAWLHERFLPYVVGLFIILAWIALLTDYGSKLHGGEGLQLPTWLGFSVVPLPEPETAKSEYAP